MARGPSRFVDLALTTRMKRCRRIQHVRRERRDECERHWPAVWASRATGCCTCCTIRARSAALWSCGARCEEDAMWRDDRAVATTGDIAEVLEARRSSVCRSCASSRPTASRTICAPRRGAARRRAAREGRGDVAAPPGIEEYRELEEAWQVDAQSELTEDQGGAKPPPPRALLFRDARARQRSSGCSARSCTARRRSSSGPASSTCSGRSSTSTPRTRGELFASRSGRLLREKLLTFEVQADVGHVDAVPQRARPHSSSRRRSAPAASGLGWLQFLLARELPLPACAAVGRAFRAASARRCRSSTSTSASRSSRRAPRRSWSSMRPRCSVPQPPPDLDMGWS